MDRYEDENKLISSFEENIGPVISDCFPYEWDEDHITFSLLKNIRKDFNRMQCFGWDQKENIDWSAYKYNGDVENKYGDIGVLVKLIYKDGRILEGVGFIEAKRRYQGKMTFDAMKLPQIRRINKNAPHSYVLLYDYEAITGFISNHSIRPRERQTNSKGLAVKPITYALAVQTSTVLATSAKDMSLYKHGVPFSHLLVNRYFNGLDLEFNPKLVNDVKAYNQKKGFVNYLLNVVVYEPGTRYEEEKDINLDRYEEL